MSVIVLSSPASVFRGAAPDSEMIAALKAIKAAGNPVGLVSNQAEPAWFNTFFGGSGVQFLQEIGRQGGQIVARNAAKFHLKPYDVLVLAVKGEDVAMGKNGGALLLGAEWSADPKVKSLGLKVESPADLKGIIELKEGWSGQWYFSADTAEYSVRALSDLSSKKHGLTFDQQQFANQLTATVKQGGGKLKALLAVTARSLLMEGIGEHKHLLFGTYPSSNSANNDTEILSDFVHRIRTTVSQVQMARRGEPLFVRHKPSSKRSSGAGGDRTDPTEQLLSIHINPYYRQGGRLSGKHVVVIDDCTTYGVSFGVAAALLKAGGARSVTGIALGKFGNQARHYKIAVSGDPFRPLSARDFGFSPAGHLAGTTKDSAQYSLQSLIG